MVFLINHFSCFLAWLDVRLMKNNHVVCICQNWFTEVKTRTELVNVSAACCEAGATSRQRIPQPSSNVCLRFLIYLTYSRLDEDRCRWSFSRDQHSALLLLCQWLAVKKRDKGGHVWDTENKPNIRKSWLIRDGWQPYICPKYMYM